MMNMKLLVVSAIAVVGLMSTSAEAHVSVFIGPPPPPPPPVWVAPVSYYQPVVHYHPVFVRYGHGYVQEQGPAFYDDCHHHDHRGASVYYRDRPAPRFYGYTAASVHHDHHDHHYDSHRSTVRYDVRGRGNDNRGRGNDRGRRNTNVGHRR